MALESATFGSQFLSETWVIIPVFNEGLVVADVVAEVLESFPKVLCIDDGSTDGTADALSSLDVTLLRHPINLGQGAALRTGFEYLKQQSDFQFVVTFDADGQHSPNDAINMISLLKEGEIDFVFGTRFGSLRSIGISETRRFLLRSVVKLKQKIRGSQLTDTNNGIRAFTRGVLYDLEIIQNGMAHASEIESIVQSARWRIAEVPVTVQYTTYSVSKGQSLLNGINILFDLIWK